MITEAKRHLQRDAAFAKLFLEIADVALKAQRRTPYEALVRAIAHQQLHGRAAEAILGRFIALYPGARFPKPDSVLDTDDAALRSCGFSAGKILAIRDICEKTVDRTVPGLAAATRMSDAELIARLTSLRGVGRWTVEMLLIFTLGRPDVLPVDDFGVREGYRHVYGLDSQPKAKQLAEAGEAWGPWRSYAALYLWRAADRAKIKAPEAAQ
jgi:DNA-3-methyladenine glycosylase II